MGLCIKLIEQTPLYVEERTIVARPRTSCSGARRRASPLTKTGSGKAWRRSPKDKTALPRCPAIDQAFEFFNLHQGVHDMPAQNVLQTDNG